MDIPSAKYLIKKASNRLENGESPKEVVLVYAAILSGASLGVTTLRYFVSNQISQTGGLQNIGLRSGLSTVNTVLWIFYLLLTMCLDLGYIAAMLRIARHQFASPKTLRAGAERFWVLLRTRILQALIYGLVAFALIYVATTIFTLTPLSSEFSALMVPLTMDVNFSLETLMADEAILASIYESLIPMFLIYLGLFLIVGLFISYRYRLVNYILVEQPQMGAMNALRQSRILMRNNITKLIKVDLRFWWYYVISVLSSALLYLDVVLSFFGVSLPFSADAQYFATLILYLLVQFAILYYLRNRIEVTYALFYDALAPKSPAAQQENGGAVLGSIFDL